MPYRFMADALVVFHLTFVGFVIFGGLLVVWRRQLAFLHLPAAAWGVFIEFSGLICPLTPLENHWRLLGGRAAYAGGFVDHYIMPVLYPRGLTHSIQYVLGAGILVLNIAVYTIAMRQARRERLTKQKQEVVTADSSPH